MRIISGKYKGRKLYKLNEAISPTKDNVKESIFNIIRSGLDGSAWLDLFCGTGAIGLEAYSRGARYVEFVDRDVRSLLKNISALGLDSQDNIRVIKQDARRYLEARREFPQKFDFIYLDPPYKQNEGKFCLQRLDGCDILQTDGIILYEHRKDAESAETLDTLEVTRTVNFGLSSVSFYARKH